MAHALAQAAGLGVPHLRGLNFLENVKTRKVAAEPASCLDHCRSGQRAGLPAASWPWRRSRSHHFPGVGTLRWPAVAARWRPACDPDLFHRSNRSTNDEMLSKQRRERFFSGLLGRAHGRVKFRGQDNRPGSPGEVLSHLHSSGGLPLLLTTTEKSA